MSYKIICLGANVCVYGLSSEGYSLASTLAIKGANVSIVDESKRMAFHLTAQIARNYSDVNTLSEEEPLLRLEPEEVAIQNSEYLFFAPRIRKVGQEARNEMISRVKDALSNIKKGSSFIFNIPIGFGMNLENIELIERVSGFTSKDINYYYMPLNQFITPIIGYANEQDDRLFRLLTDDIQFLDLRTSEVVYISRLLAHYTPLISVFEACKNTDRTIEMEGFRDIYIDDISSGLFDLRLIALSLTSNPLSSIINGSIKSIENYIKYLADNLKKTIKSLELKVSKTKVYLAWRLDTNEIRGDKIKMRELLESKLRDYISDVSSKYINTIDDKTLIVITCSRDDFNSINSSKSMSDIVIKANPFCELVKR